jgi:hypothetical protein
MSWYHTQVLMIICHTQPIMTWCHTQPIMTWCHTQLDDLVLHSPFRTNVAQFMVGMCALGNQMAALGLSQSTSLESSSPLALIFMEMYTQLGDTLAIQYGGSETNKRVASDTNDSSQQVRGGALRERFGKLPQGLLAREGVHLGTWPRGFSPVEIPWTGRESL